MSDDTKVIEKPVECVCGGIPRQMNQYPQEHLTDMFCVECACGVRGPFTFGEDEAVPAWDKMQLALNMHDRLVAFVKGPEQPASLPPPLLDELFEIRRMRDALLEEARGEK